MALTEKVVFDKMCNSDLNDGGHATSFVLQIVLTLCMQDVSRHVCSGASLVVHDRFPLRVLVSTDYVLMSRRNENEAIGFVDFYFAY